VHIDGLRAQQNAARIAQPGNEERYTASLEGWAKSL
jgi:hypothetical protein